MSAATNPFAAALEAHKDDERAAPPAQPNSPVTRHNPHNPFANAVAASAYSPPASPSTNPFRTTSPSRAPTAAANAYTVPDSNATYSADTITQSLSGLDFGAGTAFAPPAAPPAQPHFDTQPSAAIPNHEPHTSTGPPAMTTVYAPPPGPPPGHPDAVALEQVRQMEADEAYARQVFARDQEREQRRAQRHQQRSSGAGESASSVAATTAMAQDRQTQKRRQQSYDPALAAVGGAPAPHHAASPGPAIDPRAPLPPTLGAADHTNGAQTAATTTTEKQWNTKEIYWQGRSQRVVVQNENGPCSLIALCNVLLMRGSVQITPADRPAVSYEYLSSMLGEHLIDVISTQPGEALDLEAALSILPRTQYGLDVNVKFSSIDGFAVEEEESSTGGNLIDDSTVAAGSSSVAASSAPAQQSKSEKAATQRGELALFKLCNVPLVHGWLVDPADKETWEAVITRAGGHYDGALDRVVAGDELTKGMVVESSGGDQAALDNLSSSDRQVVQDALLIRRFLESTATQLTYPGLYALSTTLQRGSLYALFRNSHLSVLYRPTEHELAQSGSGEAPPSHDQPQLYQLVTDATLENEDGIVWESVEDVDGSASRFYDGKFRPAQVQNDFVGQRRSDGDGGGAIDQDADFAYAQHLQEQEHVRADRHRRTADAQRRQRTQQQQQQQQQQSGNAGGGLIARMLANRKANKRAPSSQAVQQNVAEQNGATSSGNGAHMTDGYHEPPPSSAPSNPQYGDAEELPQRGDKKWWKKVF